MPKAVKLVSELPPAATTASRRAARTNQKPPHEVPFGQALGQARRKGEASIPPADEPAPAPTNETTGPAKTAQPLEQSSVEPDGPTPDAPEAAPDDAELSGEPAAEPELVLPQVIPLDVPEDVQSASVDGELVESAPPSPVVTTLSQATFDTIVEDTITSDGPEQSVPSAVTVARVATLEPEAALSAAGDEPSPPAVASRPAPTAGAPTPARPPIDRLEAPPAASPETTGQNDGIVLATPSGVDSESAENPGDASPRTGRGVPIPSDVEAATERARPLVAVPSENSTASDDDSSPATVVLDNPIGESSNDPESGERATDVRARADTPKEIDEQIPPARADAAPTRSDPHAPAPQAIAHAAEVSDVASAPKAPPPAQTAQPASPPAAPAVAEMRFAESNHASIVTAIRGEVSRGGDGGAIQLRLDPPQLGTLHVLVQMRDGVMTASFHTSTDEATRLLSHSLNQLRHVLETQGVSVEKLQVQQTPREQQSGNDQQQGHAQRDPANSQQEQQRREMLQRMWRRLTTGTDPLDMVA